MSSSLTRGVQLASLAVLSPFFVHMADAALVLDQSQTVATDPLVNIQNAGQTFEPGATTVAAIEALTYSGQGSGTDSVTVNLYSGMPGGGGALLATATDSSVTPGAWISAVFSTPVSVTPDADYYFTLSDTKSFGLMGTTYSSYTRGQLYYSGSLYSGYDLTFKTYAAPEPTALSAMGIGACYLLKRRRRTNVSF